MHSFDHEWNKKIGQKQELNCNGTFKSRIKNLRRTTPLYGDDRRLECGAGHQGRVLVGISDTMDLVVHGHIKDDGKILN